MLKSFQRKLSFALTAITVLLLLLSLFAHQDAFATNGDIAEGQQVEIVIKVMTNSKYSYTLLICYNIDDFTMDDDSLKILVGPVAGSWLTPTYNSSRKDIENLGVAHQSVEGKSGSHVQAQYASSAFPSAERPIAGTDIFKCRLTAKRAVNIDDDSFYVGTGIGGTAYEISDVTILDSGGATAPAYTIAATSGKASNATATVGDVFDVDIAIAADPAVTNWASLQTYLNYNSARVTPGALPSANGLVVSQESEGKLRISRTGEPTAVDANGVTVVSIPFTASAAGNAEFSVTDPKASLQGEQVMTGATAGTVLSIEITAAVTVTFDEDFAGAPAGYKLLKYALSEMPDVIYTYDGEPMHYALINGTHYVTYIVANDVMADNAGVITPTSTPVTANDGDINGDTTLEIVDAQIAYDLATGVHDGDEFVKLSVAQRLKADFNADGVITVDDAYAIQYKLHNVSPTT
jgi:hypothetical protein